MALSNLTRGQRSVGDSAASFRHRLVRFGLTKILGYIDTGSLVVQLPGGDCIRHVGQFSGPDADISFSSWKGLRRIVAQGDIGFASGYLDGEWTSSDVETLIELGARNGMRLMDALSGSLPFRLLNWMAHRGNANTRTGSRRNIESHYDLGNEFYRHWLDERMIYSSAIYRSRQETLEEAQRTKLSRIVEKLKLSTTSTVLEIGGGWGGLAATIARAGANRVTSLTISPAQLAEAKSFVQKQEISERVEFKLQDYRDVKGRFDRIVSIEMIEAVGREYIPKYFETIKTRLKPGGICVLQAITIAEDRFAAYCRRPDFIQRYVFPGGFLPSQSFLRDAIEKADLKLVEVENFGESYAETLREWRRRFLENWPQIERLGFDAPFRRLWEYYLCYCEAGFRAGSVDVGLYSIQHSQT